MSARRHREMCNSERCMEMLQQLKGQRGSTCQWKRELQHQSMFLAQQRGQLGVFFVSRVFGAITLGRSVECRTFKGSGSGSS